MALNIIYKSCFHNCIRYSVVYFYYENIASIKQRRWYISSSEFPRVGDNEFEVLIIINGSWNILVEFFEFCKRNLAVSLDSVPLAKPLVEQLILGLSTASQARVLRNIINTSQIFEINNTVSALVKLLEGTLNNSTTTSVQVTTEAN